MGNRTLRYGLVLTVVLMAVVTVGAFGVAAEDTVSDSNATESNGTVEENVDGYIASDGNCAGDPCWTSFQDAIDSEFTDPGDTLWFQDGILTEETVDIDKDNLTIVGDRTGDPGESVVWSEPDEATAEPTMTISADGVTLDTFDIERFGASDRDEDSPATSAISVTGANAELVDVRINGSGADTPGVRGLTVENGASATFYNESVRGFETGVLVADDANAIVADDVTFTDTEMTVVGVDTGLDEYTDENGEVDISGLQTAIDDWRAGDVDVSLLRELIDAWRGGEAIE